VEGIARVAHIGQQPQESRTGDGRNTALTPGGAQNKLICTPRRTMPGDRNLRQNGGY
jgi:hypothetical protein